MERRPRAGEATAEELETDPRQAGRRPVRAVGSRGSRWQAGEGNLGCILWALVLIAVVHIGWVMVPVKVSSAKLHDFMEDQALIAGRSTPEQIERRILARAKQLELPLVAKKIEVVKTNDLIRIKAAYTVPVEFVGGYVYEWSFDHDLERPIFII